MSNGSNWFSLRVGRHICRVTRMVKDRETFKDADREGTVVKRAKAERQKTTWVYENGKTYNGDVFKLIGGQPKGRLKRTKEIENFEKVDVSELADAIIEDYYLIDSPTLYDELLAENKAIKCLFTNGGFSISQAYIVAEQGQLIMYLTWGKKSLEICNIMKIAVTQKQRTKSITSFEQRATESDLFDVYKDTDTADTTDEEVKE